MARLCARVLPTCVMEPRTGQITYLGHASLLIEVPGLRVLTDPLLRRRVAHLRRLVPVAPAPDLSSGGAVLISHAHHDHLDVPSLRRLPRAVPIAIPQGYGKLAVRAGFGDVREVVPGDRVELGGAQVLVTRARHDGRRWAIGHQRLALGYVVEGPPRIYFAGDTDLFDGMSDLAGGLDVALLPVAGWGTRLPEGHLDPEGAARALALLRPRIAIPIHWGTYASPLARVRDPGLPAREFARLAAVHAPQVEVRVLRPGEGTSLVPTSGPP